MYDIEKYLIFRYENGIIFWKDSPSLEKYTKIFTDEVKYVVFLQKECEVGGAEGAWTALALGDGRADFVTLFHFWVRLTFSIRKRVLRKL